MSTTVSNTASAGKSRILPFFLLFIGVFLVFTGITLTVIWNSQQQKTCGFVFIALGLICLLGSLYILLWKGNHQGPFVTRVKVYHYLYSSAFTTSPIFDFILSNCIYSDAFSNFFRQFKEIPLLLIFLHKSLGVLRNHMPNI